MSDDQNPKWGWIYYASTLTAGTISAMATKAMSKETAPLPGNDPRLNDYFQHPYILTFGMFIGEFLCLPIFYISKFCCGKKKDTTGKVRVNPFLCAIPATCDTIASALVYNAYNLTAVSVVQMLTGVRIIFTAILSLIFLKAKFYVHHIVGLICSFVGLLLVGLAVFTQSSGTSTALGVIFLISSYIIGAIQVVVEEFLFRKYTLHPLEIIGYESSAGCIISLIMLFVLQYIPCDRVRESGDHNIYPQTAHCPYGRYEDSTIGLYQLERSSIMLVLMIIIILSLCIFNFTGQGVTKHLSATARTTVSVIQTVILWIINMMIGWEKFILLQLFGFLIGTIGVMLYNEIYVPPIKGFDYNTKANIAKREAESKTSDHNN